LVAIVDAIVVAIVIAIVVTICPIRTAAYVSAPTPVMLQLHLRSCPDSPCAYSPLRQSR
jgi:hypothetical protein